MPRAQTGPTFKIVDKEYGTFDAAIPTAGVHTVYDALAAYAAATRLGLDAARCAAALATYQTTGMRQHIVEKGGVTFIEDCYNASPDSMKAALSVLKALPNARKIALLGDMLELGDASVDGHRHTGEWAADAGVDVLIAYGARSAAMADAAKARGVATVHCQTAEEVLQYLRQFVRPEMRCWQRPVTPWVWSSCFRISTPSCRRGNKKGFSLGEAVTAGD